MRHELVERKLNSLIDSFASVLDDDGTAACPYKSKDDKYRYWEWPQGVGLFGLWKLYEKNHDDRILDILIRYYDRRLEDGLPGKDVNTMAPILTLSYLAELTGRKDYLDVCIEWVEWLMNGGLPRTPEHGFQHKTRNDINEGELWDDTLMMAVMPLASMGRILGRTDYQEEAMYQTLLHIEHLADPVSGLWYHGYTFRDKSHFSGAFWGRGNSWITMVIPLLMEILPMSEANRKYLAVVLERQIAALLPLQDQSGLWHTILDDSSSYTESSCTAGFGFGMLKGMKEGIISSECFNSASRALDAILSCIDENGILTKCSGGTPMGRNDKSFYNEIPIRPMPYGQAMAMLFLSEAM